MSRGQTVIICIKRPCIYSGNPVSPVTRQIPKISSCLILWFLQRWPLYIAVILYITVTLPFPKGDRCTHRFDCTSNRDEVCLQNCILSKLRRRFWSTNHPSEMKLETIGTTGKCKKSCKMYSSRFDKFILRHYCLLGGHLLRGGGGGGGTPLYKPKRYVPPQKGRVFDPFWSENGYRLCPFWSGIGYGLWGNYGSVWTYVWFQLQMTKNEREIQEFEMDFKKSFLLPF